MRKNKNASSFFGKECVLNVLLTTGLGKSLVQSCGDSSESDDARRDATLCLKRKPWMDVGDQPKEWREISIRRATLAAANSA